MAVMDVDVVYYCCLYGNNENEVIIRHIERDSVKESEMIALEEHFWLNHVQAKVPPPYIEEGDLVLDSVKNHFGYANPTAPDILLGENYADNVSQFLKLQEEKSKLDADSKAIEAKMKQLKGKIVDQMGISCQASCAVNGVFYDISFNPSLKTGIDKDNLLRLKLRQPEIYEEYVTTTESRRFYVKERKAEKEAA